MLSDEEKNQNFNNVGVATVKRKEQNEERKEERKEDMKKVRKKEADQEKEGKANSGVREHKTQTWINSHDVTNASPLYWPLNR